jgi:hypothetical protein
MKRSLGGREFASFFIAEFCEFESLFVSWVYFACPAAPAAPPTNNADELTLRMRTPIKARAAIVRYRRLGRQSKIQAGFGF